MTTLADIRRRQELLDRLAMQMLMADTPKKEARAARLEKLVEEALAQ